MKSITRVIGMFAAALLVPAIAMAQMDPKKPMESASHAVVPAASVTFAPIEIPGFDSGVKIAAVYGDPNAESGFYVIRLAFPAGYKFPSHWHPMAENLTVLEGEFLIGMGNQVDPAKLTSYKPGSFMYIPGKMAHFGGVKGATVVQLHGQAPFKIELANK